MYHYFLAYDPLVSENVVLLMQNLHKSCDDLAEVFTWLVDHEIDHHFTATVTPCENPDLSPHGDPVVRLYLVLAHEADTVALRLRWGGASPKTPDDPTFLETLMWLA